MLRYYDKGELIWVAPGAIRYDAVDIDFLLDWLSEMREGVYPAEPTGGYVEGKRAGIASRAYYEAACQVAAEIDRRLARTGLDRYLVEEFYCRDWLGLSEDEILDVITGHVGIEKSELQRRLRSAVSYIASGTCPRWLHCIDCPEYQNCRKKNKGRVGITYRQWKGHRRVRISHLPSKT